MLPETKRQSVTLRGKPGREADLAGLNWPDCDKCHKPVDEIEVENILESRENGTYIPDLVFTGERILHVRCHGETYSVSNLRGTIPAWQTERRNPTAS